MSLGEGSPLLGNFPRLFKNRSKALATIPSTIILALNCLSLAPYLSSKFQGEALGGGNAEQFVVPPSFVAVLR